MGLVSQVAPSLGLICKRITDLIVNLAPEGACEQRLSCLTKIKDQSNSLHSVSCCNMSVRLGDLAPFLDTNEHSVRLGRTFFYNRYINLICTTA